MKNLLANWKTTSAGILAIAGGVTLYLNDKSKFMEALTSVLIGVGLLFGADAHTNKEDIKK